ASHGNSGKDHRRQPVVAASIAEQVTAGERGLTGVMLESFLQEGRQEPGPPERLTYGQSVTDACMDFETTVAVLDTLSAAVRSRRKSLSGPSRSTAAKRSSAAGVPGGRPRVSRAPFSALFGTRSGQRRVSPRGAGWRERGR